MKKGNKNTIKIKTPSDDYIKSIEDTLIKQRVEIRLLKEKLRLCGVVVSETELCQCDELANINDSLIGEETCVKCDKIIDRHN